jgi:xylobiose transport system substrate-binding protein
MAAVAAVAMSAADCSSTGSSTSSKSSNESIQVWVLQDQLDVVQKAAVARFNKTSAVKVKLTEVASDGYPDKVRTAMGSNKAPDVFFNWGGGSIRDYVDAKLLLPLTDAVAKNPGLGKAYVPAILDAGKVDGVQYGIPLRGTQPVVMFYNKKVFADNGLNPPKTWADVQALITAFKGKGVIPFAVAGAGTASWTELMWLEYLLDRNAGPKVFADIAAGNWKGWSDPGVLKAAQTVKQLVDQGAFGKNFGSVNYGAGGTSTLVSHGKAAMQLMGTWEYSVQLAESPAFAKKDLGYAAFPSIPGGKGDPADVVGNPTNYFSVNAATKHKDTAIAFLNSMSSPAYTADLVKQGEVPTTLSAASFLDKSPDPAFAKFQFKLVSDAPAFQLSWDQALTPNRATPLITEIGKLFNGQDTPEKFVAAVSAIK